MKIAFDNSFYRDMSGFYAPAEAMRAPAPALLAFNDALAERLGIARTTDSDADLAAFGTGSRMPDGAQPIALAYAGHQFGHFNPQLGDGRALLLGEVVAPDGARFDLQLKGSGPTQFSRNGDGLAAIGPVLREYLVSDAMAAMGVPTTRALMAVATGGRVQRERAHPGAVLTRVAQSHIRVGTFQFFAAHFGVDHVRQLGDYSIARHFPAAAQAANPYLALLDAVIARQCDLVAAWLGVGFIHGVMNTDNVAISGETIDYGPCAFLDRFSAGAVFSSIDAMGRYAYGNQPTILHWNMARFAEALLPAIDAVNPADVEGAKAAVMRVPDLFRARWHARMRAKLGLVGAAADDIMLIDDLFALMVEHGVDFTLFFRALADVLRGEAGALTALFTDAEAPAPWLARWWALIERGSVPPLERADAMDRINPAIIPRNHHVEAALTAAEAGDLVPFEKLLTAVRRPFDLDDSAQIYARSPASDEPYVTYCGT